MTPPNSVPRITTGQMEQIDILVPEQYGIPAQRLMENAGYQIADFIRQTFDTEKTILIYTGTGNNGGDGLAAARRLHLWGYTVELCPVSRELNGLPATEMAICQALNIPMTEDPDTADVIIDALIGYNLKDDPRPPVEGYIEHINQLDATVISIDVPTGVDADTGDQKDPHVRPDVTITLGLPKTGLSEENAGEQWLADISIPPEAFKQFDIDVSGLFRDRSRIHLETSPRES